MERTFSFLRRGVTSLLWKAKKKRKALEMRLRQQEESTHPSGGTGEQEVAPGDATVSILIIPLLSLEVL